MTVASDRAGAYAYIVIYRFVEDVRMASYPQTPEETGGQAYRYFTQCLDDIERLIGPDADRAVLSDAVKTGIQCTAFDALQRYVEENRAAYESGALPAHECRHFEHFKAHGENARDLRGGVSPQKLLAVIKARGTNAPASSAFTYEF